ncbi:cytochrome P450 4F4-like isoform X1 [Mizuhopecten yessoensis]|uniref:cytochrome P450 4F4-like isoform X1 n=2 Tax=Mizuhopecten yessoensis TaxID=6573 RepID=UPI000B45B499|nr:cytochrome P450 4F4-like isoform X1 [Mizuhopecten yessoensis]
MSMAGWMEIVLALVVGYVLWKVIPVLWRYYTFCQLVKPFKSKRKSNWFLGHLIHMSFTESVITSIAKLMEDNTNKMMIEWMSFIPNLHAIHPDTAATILKSSEPKPKGRGEPYSLFTPFLGDGLVVSNGTKWERNRKLLTPAFHFDILRPYVDIYNEAADILLDKYAKNMSESPNSLDVMDGLNLVTLDIILRCSLSYDGNIQEYKEHPYVKAIHEISRLTMVRVSKPWYFLSLTLFKMTSQGKEYMNHVNYIHRFADEVIAIRKKAIADDLSLLQKRRKLDFLDILLTAKDESGSGLTDEEIRDEVDTFMFAGHDTTKAVLGWAIYNLGKYPEEQEKLFREVCDVTGDRKDIEWEDLGKLKKMSMFLKETMRMYTPAGSTTRSLTKPLEIEGVTLPAGTWIMVNFYCIHYRPDIFPNPTEFRPERFLPENTENRHPYAFLPFSAGPRNCIGQNFSMNEQKVLLGRIIKRFRVVLDENHEVIPVPLFIVQARDGIKVRFEER